MAVFKVKLARPQKHVMREMTEGTVAQKGTWRRLTGESNSALQYEARACEDSFIFGSPDDIRLYDPNDTKSALLGPETSQADGSGETTFEGFGGAFGDDPFSWFKV